jgi:hypothetical protein
VLGFIASPLCQAGGMLIRVAGAVGYVLRSFLLCICLLWRYDACTPRSGAGCGDPTRIFLSWRGLDNLVPGYGTRS